MEEIKSAPTDATHILLYGAHEKCAGKQYLGWCEGWSHDGQWFNLLGFPSHPTHWMELPERGALNGTISTHLNPFYLVSNLSIIGETLCLNHLET